MGQIEVERGHRDIAVGDRLEIGGVAGRVDHRAEAEPVIIVAARIGALVDPEPAVVAQPLADDADALDLVGRQRREVDVDQGARRHRRGDERAQHAFRPGLGGGERDGVAHALAGVALD